MASVDLRQKKSYQGTTFFWRTRWVGDEQRWIAVGSTFAGRILIVVFAVRNEAMRPITGWAADKETTALYFREWGPV